ncbi:MAG: iron ABC transporter permease [Firmicutes bacterium]|nr:iron ABC transporter permease [Bacillota bacterium]
MLYFKALFWGHESGLSTTTASVISEIRIPRVTVALIVGGALAMAGAAYQGVFRNPMVSPDILGASAGAGFGASVGILLSMHTLGVQLLSFFFGLVAVGMSYSIGRAVGSRANITLVLVLAGIVISALFSAFISITKYLADPYSKLPEITFWLMGSLAAATPHDLIFVLPPVAISAVVLLLLRWRLNVLVFGDEEASALGMDTQKYRLVIIVCSTLLTASVVSISGLIGWVGLVIPHFSRLIIGPNYRYLLPASFLVGGLYLLLVDNLARNLLRVEIPLGILTAVIGAPVFIFLLLRSKREWQ